jgi:hypothetical protein
MKRVYAIVVIATVLVLLSLRFPLPLFAAETDGEVTVVIRECGGDVQVKKAGGDWVPALAGMPLENSSLISTGFRSTALLAIGNSTILVRPLTRLSLEELAARDGNEAVDLGLRAGRVRAEVSPPSNGSIDFRIHSPSVTASVRGTNFDFDAISMNVHEGTVFFSAGNATVLTPVGKSAVIDRQGRPLAPASAAERRMAQVSGGAAEAVSVSRAAPAPVSPVVAGPGGALSVPGVIGGPGGGAITGGANLGAAWGD